MRGNPASFVLFPGKEVKEVVSFKTLKKVREEISPEATNRLLDEGWELYGVFNSTKDGHVYVLMWRE